MSVAELYVKKRFDALEGRFRADVSADDFRLRSLSALSALEPGSRILDLGCGKGRFASAIASKGFEVIGIDPSRGMIGEARGFDRLQGSSRRLPFAAETFDGLFAVEVLEHLDRRGLSDTLAEVARILRPGGVAAILDKNVFAMDAGRPWLPSVVLKRIDERRGLWMYPADAPFRESWFRPGALKSDLARHFDSVDVEFLISPGERKNAIHRAVPMTRLYTLWTARRAGGGDRG